MFCDSQSDIDLSKNQVYQEKTKQIDVTYNFIQEINVIQDKKIGITNNPAVMLTSLLPSRKFEHCLELLGVGDGKG